MLILIYGGNGSGKSIFAERLVSRTNGPRFYIATMVPQVEENETRIEKHRRQRAGLGFVTIEAPWQVGDLPVEPDGVVLLEDASNLLGNLRFTANGTREQALAEIVRLSRRCRHLVVVSISGLEERAYTGETAAYIRDIQWLNEQLLALAEAAVELKDGKPICRKGNVDAVT